MYTIAGLGNPGKEHDGTRHNVGRMALAFFHQAEKFPEWKMDGKINALVSEKKILKDKVFLVLPEGFMNNSGKSLKPIIKSKKGAESLIVIHDELDLPLGKVKISFNKSAGGHRGVESVIKNIQTESFIRIRIGISPASAKGLAKKPSGEKAILNFILGKFKSDELKILNKEFSKIREAILMTIEEGREKAMSLYSNR